VQLGDFSFNNSASNPSEIWLNIVIRDLSASVKVGLEEVTFSAANPNWEMAPDIVATFDQISATIQDVFGRRPQSQTATLLLHVVAEAGRFEEATASLVNRKAVGDYDFYGVSLHRHEQTLLIEKSLKHRNAAFIRIQHQFQGSVLFAEIAPSLLEDEMSALHMLGIDGLP
jgi:hypothetical protein